MNASLPLANVRTLGAMALILGVVGIYGGLAALLASWLPARKAASVDAMETLRAE